MGTKPPLVQTMHVSLPKKFESAPEELEQQLAPTAAGPQEEELVCVLELVVLVRQEVGKEDLGVCVFLVVRVRKGGIAGKFVDSDSSQIQIHGPPLPCSHARDGLRGIPFPSAPQRAQQVRRSPTAAVVLQPLP